MAQGRGRVYFLIVQESLVSMPGLDRIETEILPKIEDYYQENVISSTVQQTRFFVKRVLEDEGLSPTKPSKSEDWAAWGMVWPMVS